MALDKSGNSPRLHLNADPFRCCICGYYTPTHLCKRCAENPALADPNNPKRPHPAVLALQNYAATEQRRERDEKRHGRERTDLAHGQRRRQQKRDSARKRRAEGRAA